MNPELSARAEAAAWITRLHGPHRTPELEAGFRQWLAERPENASEFEGLTEVWELTGGIGARGAPRLERWEHSEESRELQSLRRGSGQAAAARSRRRPGLWATAVLVLGTCGAVGTYTYRSWATPSYSTDFGEQRVVRLSDETRVWLNSNTRLRVVYGTQERRVLLERGEAFFEVAHNRRRPFVVTAGVREVTALGTSFVVRYEPEHTAITLIEGKVSVQLGAPRVHTADAASSRRQMLDLPRAGDMPEAHAASNIGVSDVVLTPGKRLTIAKGSAPTLDEPLIETVIAWRRGEIVLNNTPLSQAAAEMNRYDETAIVIDDPATGGLIVSGLYHTGDSEGFAVSVAKMYGLEMSEREGRIHLRAR